MITITEKQKMLERQANNIINKLDEINLETLNILIGIKTNQIDLSQAESRTTELRERAERFRNRLYKIADEVAILDCIITNKSQKIDVESLIYN